jgi:hypothetical protein
MFFFVLNFFNLTILIGEKMENFVKKQGKCKQKNIAKILRSKVQKKRMLLLMNKYLQIIQIIPTLNTKNSNIKFI